MLFPVRCGDCPNVTTSVHTGFGGTDGGGPSALSSNWCSRNVFMFI